MNAVPVQADFLSDLRAGLLERLQRGGFRLGWTGLLGVPVNRSGLGEAAAVPLPEESCGGAGG